SRVLWPSANYLGFVPPCLPSGSKAPPSGKEWLHEIKHDGFRLIARKEGNRVRLYSRPGNDLTYRFPPNAWRLWGPPPGIPVSARTLGADNPEVPGPVTAFAGLHIWRTCCPGCVPTQALTFHLLSCNRSR